MCKEWGKDLVAQSNLSNQEYASPHMSGSSSTASSIVATLLPSSFSLLFRSSLVTNLLGVIGVSGVYGIYGLYGVIGTPVPGVRRAELGALRSRTVALIVDVRSALYVVGCGFRRGREAI